MSSTIGDTTFCALDLETTGANPAMHRLIEIGMVSFSLDSTLKTYESLVNPEMPVSPQARDIHGITDGELSGAPVIKDILKEVISFFDGTILVIHNPLFDLSFIAKACHESGIELPEMTAIDTVQLSRRAFPLLDNHRLDTVCSYLGVELDHHRALSDATACMEVFRKCCDALGLTSYDTLAALRSYHGSPVTEKELHGLGPSTGSVEGISAGRPVIIRYRDFQGKVTERKILPHHVIRYGRKNYIKAYCYLRGEERFFRAERIVEIK